MPTLQIQVDDAQWPGLVAILIARLGEPERGVTPRAWVEQIAARAFADVVAAAAEPPPAPPPRNKIRPSRAH